MRSITLNVPHTGNTVI